MPIESGITLKARAFRADLLPSEITSASYTNYVVAQPEINWPSGPITNGFPLTISTKTPAATIHYTTNGSEPDTNSPVYSGPIPFTGFRLTLKVKGFRDGYAASAVTEGDFGLISYDDADVTTFAGNGMQGSSDGSGTNAQFNFINAIRMDSHGNVIVGELAGAIRKISPSGQVTTLLDYQTLTNHGITTFDPFGIYLQDLCISSNDVIYFSAYFDNRIWKFDPINGLAPFAGTGAPGPRDGPPGAGAFYDPTVLVLDNQNNVLVADNDGTLIRKITPDGTITTFTHQSFANNYHWTGLALNSAGQLFGVSSKPDDSRIFQINPGDQVHDFAGNQALGWDGPADQASFDFGNFLTSAAIDSAGNLYTAMWGGVAEDRAWIRKVHSDGSLATLAGKSNPNDTALYRDGPSDQAAFNQPYSLCVAANGVVYTADANYVVRKITPVSSLQLAATLSLTDKNLLLFWPSAVSRSYRIQSSADLATWNTAADWIEGTGGVLTFTNQLELNKTTGQFFRVQVRHD